MFPEFWATLETKESASLNLGQFFKIGIESSSWWEDKQSSSFASERHDASINQEEKLISKFADIIL